MKKSYVLLLVPLALLVLATVPSYAQLGIFNEQVDWNPDDTKAEGSVSVTGEGADAVYELTADGNDIWNDADEGLFVYSEQTGAWMVGGQFTWVDPGPNDWSKIGPMIREDAADPGSVNYYLAARGGPDANDLLSPQWRPTNGAASDSYGPRVRNANYEQVQMNEDQQIWMRAGYVPDLNLVFSEYSFDGENWMVGDSRTLDMSDTVTYGFAITDHEDDPSNVAVGEVTGAFLEELQAAPWATRNLSPFVGGGFSTEVTVDILTPGDYSLTETAPEGWEITEASNGGTIDGNTVTWQLDSSIEQVSYTVQVVEGVASGDPAGFSGTIGDHNVLGDQVSQIWNPSPVAAFDGWIETGDANMGNVSDLGDGTIELISDGDDIEGTDDDMLFLFTQMEGNFTVTGSLDLFGAEGEDWSKVGVMIRDNLNNDSANAFAMIRSDLDARWQQRASNGGGTQGGSLFDFDAGNIPLPVPVRIDRVGNVVSYYVENTDGDWVNMGVNILEDLTDPVFVGFALTANVNDETALAEVSGFSTSQIDTNLNIFSRSIPVEEFVQGEAITGIQVSATVPEGQGSDSVITETPPAGWEISDAQGSEGTEVTVSDGSIEWSLNGATGEVTLTYNLSTPADAVQGDFSGNISNPNLDFDVPIQGDTFVTAQGVTQIYFVGDSGGPDSQRNSTYIDLLTDAGLTVPDPDTGDPVDIAGLGYIVQWVSAANDDPIAAQAFDLAMTVESLSSSDAELYIDKETPYLTMEQALAWGDASKGGSVFYGPGSINTADDDGLFTIADNTHPITSFWDEGEVIDVTTNDSAQIAGIAVDELAEAGIGLTIAAEGTDNARYSLIVSEEGATGWAGGTPPAGSDPAPAKRAFLGFHEFTNVFDYDGSGLENIALTPDGAILYQRLIQWLVGNPVTADGTEGGTPVPDWSLY